MAANMPTVRERTVRMSRYPQVRGLDERLVDSGLDAVDCVRGPCDDAIEDGCPEKRDRSRGGVLHADIEHRDQHGARLIGVWNGARRKAPCPRWVDSNVPVRQVAPPAEPVKVGDTGFRWLLRAHEE